MCCSSNVAFEVGTPLCLILMIQQLRNWRSSFCLSVGGGTAQVLGFSYLSGLWFYTRISTFHLPPPLSEVLPGALEFVTCFSRVFVALLLLMSLVLSPGTLGWQCFCHIPCLLSCRLHCHRGRMRVGGSWGCGCLCCVQDCQVCGHHHCG